MTNMITAIAEALRQRRNINATISELHKLSDADLHDIGIARGNIETVARGLIDVHRTVRDANVGKAEAAKSMYERNR